MARPITLFTGQWADLPLETLARKASEWGFDGLELHGLAVYAISNPLVGQAVCDRIDERHKGILPPRVWGDGKPAGVQRRAAEEMQRTAQAAARLRGSGGTGLTRSPI